jgi:hypothetical protein
VIRAWRVRWAEHITCIEEIRSTHILVRKSEGKTPLRRSYIVKCKILKWILSEIGCYGVDRI